MKVLKSLIFCLIILIGVNSFVVAAPLSQQPPGQVLYVKELAPDTTDCCSWTNACSLQRALDLAISGDQIWVAEGAYKPSKLITTYSRTATFQLESGVDIYGGFPATNDIDWGWTDRNWQTFTTTLSGDIGTSGYSRDNSFHVVTADGVDATAILNGFTITGGNADDEDNIDGRGSGGGLYNINSNPMFINLIISNNVAFEPGGGMYNASSSPILTNVTFSKNLAGFGGGMYNGSSSPTMTNVTFFENVAVVSGGGMYNGSSSPTLKNVTFTENSVTDTNNSTITGKGGGMFNDLSNPGLTNVTFSGNTANAVSGYGGGMYNISSSPMLTNVTFTGNLANGIENSFGAGMYNENSSPTLTNAIIWGNTPKEIQINNDTYSHPTVTYSDIQGGYVGDGNIEANPLLGPLANNGGFVKTHALLGGSPAIDKGSPTLCQTTDARGFPRPIDGDTISGAVCDMGAYEFGYTLTVVILGEGSVEKVPARTDYKSGDVVTLTANAAPDWAFTGWSGGATGASNPLPVTIQGNTNITAKFQQITFKAYLPSVLK